MDQLHSVPVYMNRQPGEVTSLEDSKYPRELFPRIILVLWAVWFLYQFICLLQNPTVRPSHARTAYQWHMVIGSALGGPFFVGVTGWLAFRLFARPRMVTATWFILFCLILLWKFWIGPILIHTFEKWGDHTLIDAIGRWWSSSTVNLRSALEFLGAPILLLISLLYWPFYCGKRKLHTSAVSSTSS